VPDHVNANGDVIFDRGSEERGRVDLEINEGRRHGALDVVRGALGDLSEGHVGVVCGVAGELDFEITVERGGCEAGFRQAEPDGDDGELCAPGDLKHVEVAVGVAGVEGFDWNGDKELALPGMANALSFGGVTDTVDLMHRMRHVIGEGRLIQYP